MQSPLIANKKEAIPSNYTIVMNHLSAVTKQDQATSWLGCFVVVESQRMAQLLYHHIRITLKAIDDGTIVEKDDDQLSKETIEALRWLRTR